MDPTPEQIAEACERIRAGWSEAEHERRAVVKSREWSPQDVYVGKQVDGTEGLQAE